MMAENAQKITKPIKLITVRTNEFFFENEYRSFDENIIKDYVYYPEKRIIA